MMSFHQAPTTFVGQVNLKVSDLERSLQFYQKIIGFSILNQTDSSATLTADGQHPLLTITQPEQATYGQQPAIGLYHFALLLPMRSDLANLVRHFAQIGLPFASGDHLVSEAIYLNDPDGNGIEVYVDRNPQTWRWQNNEVEMATLAVNFEDLLQTTSLDSWQVLPKETVMGHVHLQVADIASSRNFYVNGLGFQVVSHFGQQALFLSDNDYHHHIAFNTWAGANATKPLANQVGLIGFTLIYANEVKRQTAIDGLEKIGAVVFKENNDWVTIDPSGNRINLKVTP